MTLYSEHETPHQAAAADYAQLSLEVAGDTGNRTLLLNNSGTDRGLVFSGGGATGTPAGVTSVNDAAVKAVLTAAVNSFSYSRNGSAVTTDVSGALAIAMDTLRVGASYQANSGCANAPIKKLRLYNRVLSGAEAAALSTL
jgi:hypothetical protein